MPVEVRELIIKAVVAEPGGKKQSAAPNQSGMKEDIIADCVEQVMQLLRERSER